MAGTQHGAVDVSDRPEGHGRPYLNMSSASTSTASGIVVSPDSDDESLVAAALNGNSGAFRALYERYQRRLYAVAFGYVRNRDEALEILQETFIKIHRNLHRFEGNSSLYTWFYRITSNAAKDHLRRNKRRTSYEFEDGRAEGRDETHPVGNGVSGLGRLGTSAGITQQREIMEAVRASLDELSDNHRAVLTMREFQGLSYEEMSGQMECSMGTIMSRLFHARKNLQKKLRTRLAGYIEDFEPSTEDQNEERRPGSVRKAEAT
jgi:RNA polymerase sigma-70 factor (ECF subfamily)